MRQSEPITGSSTPPPLLARHLPPSPATPKAAAASLPTPSVDEAQPSESATPSRALSPPPPQPSSENDMGVAEGKPPKRSRKTRPNLPSYASEPTTKRKGFAPIHSYTLPPPPSTYLRNTTSVADLANLVKQQTYLEQKHAQCRERLEKSLIANAVSARLTRSGELCHRILVENFKSDQKSEFAALYNAIHDVRNSCEASRRFAMLDPEVNSTKLKSDDQEGQPASLSFLHELPQQARETILVFLQTIRSDPAFLANRLSRLSSAELEALVRFHHRPDPRESILPQHSSRRGAGSRSSNQPPMPSPIERLLAFHRNDPLYTLLHSIFANSTGPDSAEDQRKLDVWATVCAKLICENKGESFLMCVMDAWAAMRDWPAKANLEITLMNLLQDGAFLVDRGEDTGSSKPSDRGKNDLLAEEFWTKAERKLFEVLDDEPSAGGIPEGMLELGHAILKKIDDPKKQRHAEIIIVIKWFFNRFLANGVAYPEYHGIMTGHHISEHTRLKVLRPVLKNMYNHAVSVLFGDWKTNSPVEPVVRTHIENLIERFRCPRPHNAQPVLIPTKNVKSPPETPKVQPFIVLCPADIVTICQAVFPHSMPLTPESQDIRKGSSLVSSVRYAKSPATYDTGNSVLSNSSSSVTSESASMTAPLLDRGSFPDDRRSYMSAGSPASSTFNIAPPSLTGSDTGPELLGPAEVRSAVEAMRGRLGADVVSGRCHPCAEKWAVIYISKDGEHLSLKMRKDIDEDEEDKDDEGHESDSEEEMADHTGVDRDYEQLKHAVLKLVNEYEIPEDAAKAEREELEARPGLKKSLSTNTTETVSSPPKELDPSNPFYQSNLTAMLAKSQSKSPAPDRSLPAKASEKASKQQAPKSLLATMLQAAYFQCYSRGDYVSAQIFFRALGHLRRIAPSLQRNGYAPLLHIFSHTARRELDSLGVALDEFEQWFQWVALANDRHDAGIQDMMKKIKDLRDKMWYVTDVRNSAAYDEAKSVAIALKKMAQPQRPSVARSSSVKSTKGNLTHRASLSSFSLLKSDTLIDIMAAPAEHGGPNKLSDEQATMTYEYLSRYSVENFCKGEERIHRFCLEIDKCVTKLVGDGILDGPVLWSSELFSRDEKEMSINRNKGDLYLAGVGTLSVTADDDCETDKEESQRASSRRSMELLRRPSTSDLFGRNRSATLLTPRHETPRGGSRSNVGLMDAVDKQDFFGIPSPSVHSAESHNTFWTPFSSGGSSLFAGGKPKTTHSPTTLLKTQEMINKEKKQFLAALKQNLTGLLLSDLGLDVFSRGSETDAWFSGGLGDECIQRKEEQEETKRKAAERKKSGSRKGLSKKKSMKNVRGTRAPGGLETFSKDKKGELAAPIATLENVAREAQSGEENSSSSDAAARSKNYTASTAIKKGSLMAFPYGHAFRRLLLKFSTHPNPFQKLHALYELELLIVASLTQRSSRSHGELCCPTIPEFSTSPFVEALGNAQSRVSSLQLQQPSNIEEAIQNLEERRSNVMNSGFSTSAETPSTDQIVEVIQDLFRQSDIRPPTLFRDLQFVAAFVPASVLDMTEIGKAFWDVGLAALGLKQDVCRTMVEIADEIVQRESKTSRPSESCSTSREKQSSATESPGEPEESGQYNRYTMQDAATMWTITAKEGDPTAQRELAIFYLTNPSLLPRTTKPLSKPKDTFRPEMMVSKGEDPEKRDPATMCVSYHWMDLSAQGGDVLAREYIRSQRENW